MLLSLSPLTQHGRGLRAPPDPEAVGRADPAAPRGAFRVLDTRIHYIRFSFLSFSFFLSLFKLFSIFVCFVVL